MVKVSTTGGVEATFEDWAWKCEDDLLLALLNETTRDVEMEHNYYPYPEICTAEEIAKRLGLKVIYTPPLQKIEKGAKY